MPKDGMRSDVLFWRGRQQITGTALTAQLRFSAGFDVSAFVNSSWTVLLVRLFVYLFAYEFRY